MLYARIEGDHAPVPDALQQLEFRRTEIVKEFARLGDLRSGSVSNTSGRCGKSNCRCHQPGQSAHGPNPRLTYKVQGKTVTESLPTGASETKAELEIAQFRRFQELVREFLEVNVQICRARPTEPAPPLSQEKKRQRRPAKRPASR